MKIRTSFVTNSSSSSFVVAEIKSDTLSNLINDFIEEVMNLSSDSYVLESFTLFGNNVELMLQEDASYEIPETVLDMLNIFMSMFREEDTLGIKISEDESENKKVDLSEFDVEFASLNKKIIAGIFKHRNEILEDIELARLEIQTHGYGVENEERFNQENYKKKYLDDIYEDIADELNISIDNITQENFEEYVFNKIGIKEVTYTFVRKDGKMKRKISHNFYLEA